MYFLRQVFLLDDHRVLFCLNDDPPEPSTFVSLWDYQTGLEIKGIGFSDFVETAAMCKEKKRMAIVSTGSPIQIWDIGSATLLAQLDEYASAGIKVAFSPTEMILASISDRGMLRTWDINASLFGSNPNASETDPHACMAVSASRSGRNVISMYLGKEAILLWNTAEQTCLELNVPSLDHPLVMSSDGLYFVCATSDSSLHNGWVLYETKSLHCVYTWRDDSFSNSYQFPSRYAAFSEDSRLIAVTFPERPYNHRASIEVLDVHHKKKLSELNLAVRVEGMSFLPNGASLMIVHEAGYEIFNVLGEAKSEFSFKWNLGPEPRTRDMLSGIVPDGAQFLVIGPPDGPTTPSYLVTVEDSSQFTQYIESSEVFQIVETPSGWEALFLVHDQIGNLYKRGKASNEFLCWLPPTWRFMNGRTPAEYLISMFSHVIDR
ncbi:hypothetical protein FRC01_011543, partial [Tulasnella sp. 417]